MLEIQAALPAAATKSALPIPTSICSIIFMCPNNGMAASV